MVERSTAHTAPADDSNHHDLTVPLAEVAEEAGEGEQQAAEVIGASRDPYERKEHGGVGYGGTEPAARTVVAPTITTGYDVPGAPAAHITAQQATPTGGYNPAAIYASPYNGYESRNVASTAQDLPQGEYGRPGAHIIVAHLSALVLFAVATAASLYFFVGTATGQLLDERALTEYGNQFSRYQRSSLVMLNYLPHIVGVLAVLGLVVVLIWKHRFLPAIIGVVAGSLACVTTYVLKNDVIDKPDYGIQDALINSAPSGHTTFAAAACAALFLAAPRSLRPTFAVLGAMATCAIGVSTIINGWHRPGDVVSAIFVTTMWTVFGLVVLRYFRRAEFNSGNLRIGTVIVPLLTIATLFLGFCALVLYAVASASSLPGGIFVAATSMILACSTGTAAVLIALLRPRNRPRSVYTKVWSY